MKQLVNTLGGECKDIPFRTVGTIWHLHTYQWNYQEVPIENPGYGIIKIVCGTNKLVLTQCRLYDDCVEEGDNKDVYGTNKLVLTHDFMTTTTGVV